MTEEGARDAWGTQDARGTQASVGGALRSDLSPSGNLCLACRCRSDHGTDGTGGSPRK